MPTVESFNRDMLETFLDSHDITYVIDADGDYAFTFDVETGLVNFLLVVDGDEDQFLDVVATVDREFARGEWGRCITLCNEWNASRYWPKSYLQVEDWDRSAAGEVVLEECIDLGKGIHQELLDDYVLTVVASAVEFWRWWDESER